MPAIGTAITGALTAFKATALGTFLTQNFFGRLLASAALSALQVALMPRPRQPGITTEFTQNGGTNPLSFVLGTYATAGSMVCPPMSHGKAGKTPNAYLTYVIDLGDVPGQTLGRVIVDGAYETVGATVHPDYGREFTGRLAGHAWIKYYDGSQTVADPMLLAKYGSYPERPWLADMVGTGICYAIVTFRYNRKLFSGFPQLRFEMGGIPVYDPRADSTVGGSGPQRWSDRSTWVASANPLVLAYNIMRGVSLPSLGVWGGEIAAPDLPLSSWFSAMNACDVAETKPGGGTEPRYRAGFEVKVDAEPAAVLEELFKASLTQVAEVGGIWKVRCGGPGLPVFFLTDDDIVVTRPQEMDPFPGDDGRRNALTATYPEPEQLWEPKTAPPLYNTLWEAEDGGRRRVADLQFPAAPFGLQVQRLMSGYARDERRHRRHQLTLPPDAAVLEPLDTLSWTSARNGYVAKLFEVAQCADDLRTLLQGLSLRECDPTDFAVAPGFGVAPAVASSATVLPPAQTVAGFDMQPFLIPDATGLDRRPALRLIWDGAEQDGVKGLEWEVRLAASGVVVARGSTSDVESGAILLAEGILPSMAYEGRMRQVADWPVAWTAWEPATTDARPFGQIDLDGSKEEAGLLGPVDIPPTGYVFLTLAMGPSEPNQIWKRGLAFWGKCRTDYGATIALERRFKNSGVWGAWVVWSSWDMTTAWEQYTSSGTLAGVYEDVEMRLVVDASFVTHTAMLRDLYMTFGNIVK